MHQPIRPANARAVEATSPSNPRNPGKDPITPVTELTRLTVSGMKERGYGRVVNLSSLAALLPPGARLLYTGIKSYVLDMSQVLDMELRPHGIHVTALCPGFTHSEFHDVMGTRDAATSKLPSLLWQTPEDVVREGWRAVNNGRRCACPGWPVK